MAMGVVLAGLWGTIPIQQAPGNENGLGASGLELEWEWCALQVLPNQTLLRHTF